MQQSIDAPRRAPAPVSLAHPFEGRRGDEGVAEDGVGADRVGEDGAAGNFWSRWRRSAMRGAPIADPAEAEAFRRLATARALRTDS